MINKTLLKPRDVAKRLGVSTRTLARWRDNGNGPKWFFVETSIFYPLNAVEVFERGGKNARRKS